MENGTNEPAIILHGKIVTFKDIENFSGLDMPGDVKGLIRNESLFLQLKNLVRDSNPEDIFFKVNHKWNFDVPIRNPDKIWCIGLNYRMHASDLNEQVPEEPASFMRPFSTIIGHNDNVIIPENVKKVTGEAEMALVMRNTPKNVKEQDGMKYIFGITEVIDFTALDILEKNPRFLTRSKSFDTFFSMGQVIITTDEILDMLNLEISTMMNGKIIHKNTVSNMTFKPQFLVSFHSKIFSFSPGDILSTGTPGAVGVCHGDVVACRINQEGFLPLENHVV